MPTAIRSDFSCVMQGLLILYPYADDATSLYGQADSIIVHGCKFSPEVIGRANAERLQQLGWSWDGDGEWSWD